MGSKLSRVLIIFALLFLLLFFIGSLVYAGSSILKSVSDDEQTSSITGDVISSGSGGRFFRADENVARDHGVVGITIEPTKIEDRGNDFGR